MTKVITDLLTQLEAPGTFATRVQAPAEALAVEVTGFGRLKFPLTQRAVGKLRELARPSPFGLREETLHDPSVRNSWEIPASRVKIATRQFKPVLTQHLRTLRKELGFPEGCELKARFDKLLLYEKGQFFKPHQDSEKNDDMVATLVVILPSDYSGGTVSVVHRGETKTFRRLSSQATHLSLLAFYADCHHAISPIKSGVRVALTYRLSLGNRTGTAGPEVRTDLVDRLTAAIQAHFDTPVARLYSRADPTPPERLVYLLDHEYTQRSLAWARLKNGDSVRVAALRSAAERLDCECFLALAEVHETWDCEDDDYYTRSRYRQRRYYYDDYDYDEEDEEQNDEYGEDTEYVDEVDDAVAADEHELIELLESHIELDHWLGTNGKPIDGIPGTVGDEELYFTKPSRAMHPFESEHEGYQGNYGNTVDRWYHRAACVMWPRANTFALRAQASPQWAVDELLALPRTQTTEIELRVKALLPRWQETARQVEGARFFAKLLRLATRLDDARLARDWLAPLGLQRLANQAMRRDLVTLVSRHGFALGKELVTRWTEKPAWGPRAWTPLLADLCGELQAARHTSCVDLAAWILDRELQIALTCCVNALKRPQPWLALNNFGEATKQLADVFAAALAMSAPAVIDKAFGGLKEKPGLSTAFLAELLHACSARSPALRKHLPGTALYQLCSERLEAELSRAARGQDDWTIVYPLDCKCADCKLLSQFLQSPRTEHDWPLNEGRRQHIHQRIDSAQLPVRHKTLRRGSPYILQLRKDQTLFTREQAYRTRIKEILKAFRTSRSR